jgi:FkbM family methyltransferase
MRAKFGLSRILVDAQGSKFIVTHKNALDQLLVLQGQIDEGLPYFLNQICESESIAIDVGANGGYYSIPFAKKFLEVHSFEPNPLMHAKLQKNIKVNGNDNIYSYKSAVGDKISEVDLFIQDSIDGDFNLNSGLSSLKSRPEYYRKTIRVPLLTLDSLNFQYPVGLIKIDVEGTEFDVLRGAGELIKDSKPILLWEASVTISSENYFACLSLLSDLNYKSFEVQKGSDLMERLSNQPAPDYDFNVISIPNLPTNLDAVQTKTRDWK